MESELGLRASNEPTAPLFHLFQNVWLRNDLGANRIVNELGDGTLSANCVCELLPRESSRTGSSMPTVLIVVEDIVFRKQLLEVFDHGDGFDAFAEAGSGVEALDKTKCLSPNLAILDLSLPDVSGIELAQELMEVIPGFRVFMLTADYSMKMEKSALLRNY